MGDRLRPLWDFDDLEASEMRFRAQLEQETTLTRKVIERVPEGRNDWKPHPKSMALGYLAALVAMNSHEAAPLNAGDAWVAKRRRLCGGAIAARPKKFSVNAEGSPDGAQGWRRFWRQNTDF